MILTFGEVAHAFADHRRVDHEICRYSLVRIGERCHKPCQVVAKSGGGVAQKLKLSTSDFDSTQEEGEVTLAKEDSEVTAVLRVLSMLVEVFIANRDPYKELVLSVLSEDAIGLIGEWPFESDPAATQGELATDAKGGKRADAHLGVKTTCLPSISCPS